VDGEGMTIILPRSSWPRRWRIPDPGCTCEHCARLNAALNAHTDAIAHVIESRKAVERAGRAVDDAHRGRTP
jgi:hypothetical protein